MNRRTTAGRVGLLVLLVLLVAPALVWAQTPAGARVAEEPAPPVETGTEAALQQQLRDARERLEQALRDVGELSARMATQFAEGPFPRLDALAERMWMPPEPRAMLGVIVSRSDEQRAGDGALVSGVTPGGPADEAGVQVGDLIVSLDGEPLAHAGAPADRRLVERMREVQPGETVVLGLRRDGRDLELELLTREADPPTIAAAPSEGTRMLFRPPGVATEPSGGRGVIWPVPPAWQPWSDMELAQLSPELGAYFSVDHGLLVVRAPRDRLLALRDGDVILTIGGRTPNDVGHALRILNSYAAGETLQLQIMREHRPETLELELPERRATGSRRLLLDAPGDAPASDRTERREGN